MAPFRNPFKKKEPVHPAQASAASTSSSSSSLRPQNASSMLLRQASRQGGKADMMACLGQAQQVLSQLKAINASDLGAFPLLNESQRLGECWPACGPPNPPVPCPSCLQCSNHSQPTCALPFDLQCSNFGKQQPPCRSLTVRFGSCM